MYVIGTAGHVDHGKSMLVEALTGIDPDRLREEKQRGMTIDLGFAWLTLPTGRTVSIVDVPGHERFIKNMLAGAGGIDIALLVVAADDGVMPQTREHVAILDLLGVGRGVVALSKRDLVDAGWLELVRGEIAEELAGTALAGSPVVACSAVTREGLDDLRNALDDAVGALPVKRDIGRARLPIDRVFTVSGFGTVVTGTLIDGAIAAGDDVELLPGGARARVRGVQSHRDAVERAQPGTRVALNLAGVAKDDLRRGMVVASPGWLKATDAVDVRVRAVPALRHALRHNIHVTFHTGAAEANARLRLLDADELRAGEEAWAQLRLDAGVAVTRGDRFVLRTPGDTVAGGVVADAAPRRHRRRDPAIIARLAAWLAGTPRDRVLEAVAAQPMVERDALERGVALERDVVARELGALVASGVVRAFGDGDGTRYATARYVEAAHERVLAALRSWHQTHPLRSGAPQEEARARAGLDARAFALLAAEWEDVRLTGASAALAGFAPEPTATQRAAIDAYLAALRASPASPPTGARIDAELLAYLAEAGAVVDAGNGVVFEAGAYAALAGRALDHIAGRGSITVAEARDLFGTSRRYAQALLEEMDRRRVTRRVGDAHVAR